MSKVLEARQVLLEVTLRELLHVELTLNWLFQEVRHEMLVGNKLEPGEREGWILLWIELFEEVSQTCENLLLRLCVEAVLVVYGCQNVH
jgi:hypothetical protein